MDILGLKKLFESWVKARFKNGQAMLSGCTFCENEGYNCDTINGMWVGFCAGYFLAE